MKRGLVGSVDHYEARGYLCVNCGRDIHPGSALCSKDCPNDNRHLQDPSLRYMAVYTVIRVFKQDIDAEFRAAVKFSENNFR